MNNPNDKFRKIHHDLFFKQHPHAKFYLKATENPPRPEQFKYVTNWISNLDEVEGSEPSEEENIGLALVGKSGTGKTTALYKLAYKRSVERYIEDWKILNVATLTDQIIDASLGRGEFKTVREFFESFIYERDVFCLAIDDLDKGCFTKRVAVEIYNLLEFWLREQDRRKLFVTLNSHPQELAKLFPKQIGEAVVKRIGSACQMVNFDFVPESQFAKPPQPASAEVDAVLPDVEGVVAQQQEKP